MKVKEFISIVDCSYITICYAGFGERIYKGPLTGNIPTHLKFMKMLISQFQKKMKMQF